MMPNTPVTNDRYTRNERISLAVNVVGFCILVMLVLFIGKDSKRPVQIDPAITEELRKVNQELRASQIKLDEERKKTVEFFEKKDSVLKVEFESTRSEIKKSRNITNEKINRINGFGSAELAREFARIADSTQGNK